MKNQKPRRLRQLLLAWLLPGVALILVISGTSTYLIASGNTNRAYDRSLINLALALANQVETASGRPALNLQSQGLQALLSDSFDRTHFAVYGSRGELLAGEEGLFPDNAPSTFQGASHGLFPGDISGPDAFADGKLFFDSRIHNRDVRGAVLVTQKDGHELTVVVAETLSKREKQVGDILLSVVVPASLLLAATVALIMFAVNRGLQPLEALRDRLSLRSPSDLSPVGGEDLPAELQPLAREIDHLLRRLDVALGAQRHFFADAAHQLRTPIAGLQAQVEAAVQTRDPELLPHTLLAVRRLSRLVNQLLALARAEPGNLPMQNSVSLRRLIEEAADQWLQMAIERKIDLGFDLAEASVTGNPILLQELIGNLVDNAIRYTPEDGEVMLSCQRTENGGALIVVEDSGPGIPLSQRDRIFDRFFRGRADVDDGSGLGLAVAHRIAEQHEATIRIDDAAAGGARIELFFSAPENN
ncbi:MAG: sensor histidine kinase N-terminal domain-containing protein [Azospira sp.]|nr:sensor histidine kinase N-terminal domain-containing protein [Azospira sp.]